MRAAEVRAAEVRPRCSWGAAEVQPSGRGVAERQPRCSRGAAEVQPVEVRPRCGGDAAEVLHEVRLSACDSTQRSANYDVCMCVCVCVCVCVLHLGFLRRSVCNDVPSAVGLRIATITA